MHGFLNRDPIRFGQSLVVALQDIKLVRCCMWLKPLRTVVATRSTSGCGLETTRVEGLARKMSVDFYAASNLHANNGFQKRAECRMMLLLFNAYCYCPLILPVLLPIAIANCYCLVATAQGSRGPTNRPTDPTYRTNRPTNPTNQPDQPTRARTFTVGHNSVREKNVPGPHPCTP